MSTFSEKLKPILKERGIKLEDLAKAVGVSRNQLYIVGKQSIIDGVFLNKVAAELGIERSFLDDLRHPSVHQSQVANQNDGTVHQTIGGNSIEDMRKGYEGIIEQLNARIVEKDGEIKFLRGMIKDSQTK